MNMLTKAFALSLAWSVGMVHADTVNGSADYTSPYIDPQQSCLTEGMINPPNKAFRYLYSRDCRVVLVMPPPVMAQTIKSQGLNLKACSGVASARNNVNTAEALVDETQNRIRMLEAALENAKPSEEKSIQAKIKDLTTRLEGYTKVRDAAVARFDRDYNQMPGANFAIVMDGDVSANDLNEVRALNHANLNRRKTIVEKTIGPDGKEQTRTYEVVEASALRAAPISQSYYSFIYNLPAEASHSGGIVSSDIPGLQYLEQPGGRTGVIHVKASGGITGKVIMSIATACEHTKKGPNNELVLDDTTDPFFVVNRTFFVQQMFAQGYKARLKVDKAVNQITNFVTVHTNEGFKKSSVFLPSIKADATELMEFEWTTEFDKEKNVSIDKILEIKNAVAAKLIDNYIEKLKAADAIQAVPDRRVDPANGGWVDDTRVANRCWTERDGGLSGLFGGRHEVCSDYTYVVKVWHDGVTEEEVRRSLTLNGETTDSMKILSMAPFYFSTAFTK